MTLSALEAAVLTLVATWSLSDAFFEAFHLAMSSLILFCNFVVVTEADATMPAFQPYGTDLLTAALRDIFKV